LQAVIPHRRLLVLGAAAMELVAFPILQRVFWLAVSGEAGLSFRSIFAIVPGPVFYKTLFRLTKPAAAG
jgi:hypothetical protein